VSNHRTTGLLRRPTRQARSSEPCRVPGAEEGEAACPAGSGRVRLPHRQTGEDCLSNPAQALSEDKLCRNSVTRPRTPRGRRSRDPSARRASRSGRRSPEAGLHHPLPGREEGRRRSAVSGGVAFDGGGFFSLSLRRPKTANVRVKGTEMVLFTRQLSTMISAGIPLVEALEVLAEQTTNLGFRLVLNEITTDVRSGRTSPRRSAATRGSSPRSTST